MNVYACYNNDATERMRSSSGGVFPLLARQIIRLNGIVYAACYDNELNVVHRIIVDEQGIRASQGSKYVESDLGTTFLKVENDLKQGRTVMFVGTPCQCAGLSSFLKQKKTDCGRLFITDFVCHGVPGRTAWRAYLKSQENKGRKIHKINMRDKSSGWSNRDYSWSITDQNNNTELISHRQVSFMKGFLRNLYLRPSCYECIFKKENRFSDITLGDFWGIWKYLPEMDDNKGTSLIITNTEKGEKLLSDINPYVTLTMADYKMASAGNSSLIISVKQHKRRTDFYRGVANTDFEDLVNKLTKLSMPERIKRKIKRIINECRKDSSNSI